MWYNKHMKKGLFLIILMSAVLTGAGCASGTTQTSSTITTNTPIGSTEQALEESLGIRGPMETPPTKPDFTKPLADNITATLKTSMGDIVIKFFPKDAPMTVNNFIQLAQQGFYDGDRFHRVIKGFMIQTGDPNSKDENFDNDGLGGPGYEFQDEINSHKLVRGAVAMANAGPDTNGSQFFIVTAQSTPWLDGHHTVFGEVVSGMDVIDKIESTTTNANDHPTSNITITKVTIEQK